MNRIVLRNCLKLSEPHAGSLSPPGSEFQIVGPAIENAQRHDLRHFKTRSQAHSDLSNVHAVDICYFG